MGKPENELIAGTQQRHRFLKVRYRTHIPCAVLISRANQIPTVRGGNNKNWQRFGLDTYSSFQVINCGMFPVLRTTICTIARN